MPCGPKGVVPLVDLRAYAQRSDNMRVAPHSQRGYWAMIEAAILTEYPHAYCDHRRGLCAARQRERERARTG